MAKYVGKRIVPVHCGYWDSAKAYEMESIVYDRSSGNSYISKKTVPAGTDIVQEEYWALCSDFNMQMDLLEKHFTETEKRIKEDNDETEKKIRDSNAGTAKHIDDSLAETEKDLTERVEEAQTAMSAQKEAFDDTAERLNARMDAVLSAGTGDGQTEIADARVDSYGFEYPSLGEAVRRMDKAIARIPKLELTPTSSFVHSENGPGGTMEIAAVEEHGKIVAVDVKLNYQNDENRKYHLLRSAVRMPYSAFESDCLGKKLCAQVWSNKEIEVLWAYGYADVYRKENTIFVGQHLYPGYNDIVFDTGTGEFSALERNTGGSFYINYLFGEYESITEPEPGEYNLRMSFYRAEDLGYGCVGNPYVSESAYAVKSTWAERSGTSQHADEADKAEYSAKASCADCAMNVGAEVIAKKVRMAQSVNNAAFSFDESTGLMKLMVTGELWTAADSGFTVCLGSKAELIGKKLILLRREKQPFLYTALNAGASWGGHTYMNIQFDSLYGDYWVLDFDTAFQKILENRPSIPTDFSGDVYLMVYGNQTWTLPEEGAEYQNEYAVYLGTADDTLLYAPMLVEMKADLHSLEETVAESELQNAEENRAALVMLKEKCVGLEKTVEALQSGNVLWGKKYFATGDSFTEGDFSGWTDENGLSGKNSPVIYDAEWKIYKTYPWWIARRNNMMLVNDGKCGSIMPLSKQYVNGDDGVAESYRQPFSLTRYKNIPEDADYITLWFGINDSANTNLGTIDDATNETYYGAWNVVLEWILTNRPYAKIGIIITNGAAAAYRQATREIA